MVMRAFFSPKVGAMDIAAAAGRVCRGVRSSLPRCPLLLPPPSHHSALFSVPKAVCRLGNQRCEKAVAANDDRGERKRKRAKQNNLFQFQASVQVSLTTRAR